MTPREALQAAGAGAKIRRLREARGWTQAHLASRVGTSQQTIDRIERGETEFSRWIAPALEVLSDEESGGAMIAKPTRELTVAGGRVKLNLTAEVSMATAARILEMIEADKAL